MSLSGIFSALSMKKGKSRRKKGQDTSSGEDASPSHSPAPSEREGKQKSKGGAKSSIFGSSSAKQQPQQQQESVGFSTGGRVEVPPDRAERTPWGKAAAKKDAGTKKGKKGTGYDRMRFYLDRSSALRSLRAFIGSPGRVTLFCAERTRLVLELLELRWTDVDDVDISRPMASAYRICSPRRAASAMRRNWTRCLMNCEVGRSASYDGTSPAGHH